MPDAGETGLGEDSMRAVVATSLSLLIGSTGGVFANSRGWDASPHPGEAKNPAIGCSVGTNDDYWTCLAVRCEDSGGLGLYYEYSDGGTNNPFSIEIDGEKFPIRPEASGEGVVFPTRLVGDVPSIVSRLKAGKQVKLVDMTPPLNRGFDTIPLRGSSRAIGAVETSCIPAGGVQASAGEPPRDASGWRTEKAGSQVTAKGCSLTSDYEFLCIEVGCSAKQDMTLHGLLTGEILEGKFELQIDGKPFAIEGGEYSLENAASRTELAGDMDGIIAAMKSGTMLVVHYPDLRFEADFEKIPLRGFSRAIDEVEAMCVPADGAQASAGALLRDASGRVSLGNLNNSKDCAFAKTTGTVEDVSRGGPNGTIDGVSYADDKFGSSFANVDALKAGPDLQARQATLDYLLTPGRRLSIEIRGCGAAGRIEKLVSATEIP